MGMNPVFQISDEYDSRRKGHRNLDPARLRRDRKKKRAVCANYRVGELVPNVCRNLPRGMQYFRSPADHPLIRVIVQTVQRLKPVSSK